MISLMPNVSLERHLRVGITRYYARSYQRTASEVSSTNSLKLAARAPEASAARVED